MYYIYFCVFLNPAVMGYIINGSRQGHGLVPATTIKKAVGSGQCAASHYGISILR